MPIFTTSDLLLALAALPPDRRVVLMVDGEVVPCELTVERVGDWCVLNVVREQTDNYEIRTHGQDTIGRRASAPLSSA